MGERQAIGGARAGTDQGRKTFVSVQYLRAVAALMVVGIHLQEQLERMGWESHLIDYGSAGVDIFFVISGFVMWHTAKSISPLTFYYRRIVRIVPLYWLLTSVMLAILLVAPGLLNSARFDPGHVLASYFFIAQPHPVLDGAIFPLLVPGWTLNYEMFFYALFGLMLTLKREWRLIGIVGLFCLLVIFHLAFDPGASVLGFYTNPILLEFPAGCVLGYAVERGLGLRWSSAAVLIAAGTVLIVLHMDTIRLVRDGLGAILVVTGIVLAEARKSAAVRPFLMLVGDASYSIYLVHVLVLAAMLQIFQRTVGFESAMTAAIYVAVSLAAVLAASILLYRGFEKPSLNILRHGFGSVRRLSRNW